MTAPRDRASLLACWDRLVSANPDARALLSADGDPLSRKQLDLRALESEERLRGVGLRAGHLLVMQLPNGPDWMATFLAAWRLGVAVVPIDIDATPDRARETAKQIGAFAIVCAEETRLANPARLKRFRDREIALGKVTSGSSGSPKVFYFKAGEAIADGARIIQAMDIRPDDVNLGLALWGHSYGLGNIVMPLLIQGTATTWGNAPWPHDIARSVERTRATILPSVPTALRALCESGVLPTQLATLRLALSAGARLEPELARRFRDVFGITVRNFYGSSETGGLCFDATGERALEGGSVGSPLPGVRFTQGRGDRVYAESDAVFTLGNRRRNGRNGVCLLADRARLLPSGELQLLGRAGRFAKVGGKRISLPEVEDRLREIDGVEDAFACEIQLRGEGALAAAAQSTRAADELDVAIRAAIPRSLRPKRFMALPRFPQNARGKTDAAALFALLSAERG